MVRKRKTEPTVDTVAYFKKLLKRWTGPEYAVFVVVYEKPSYEEYAYVHKGGDNHSMTAVAEKNSYIYVAMVRHKSQKVPTSIMD